MYLCGLLFIISSDWCTPQTFYLVIRYANYSGASSNTFTWMSKLAEIFKSNLNILKQLFLSYSYQLQTSKCRIVSYSSSHHFSSSRLPPWRNKAAGLPVNTGCNYGQQWAGAIEFCGSLCKAQECSLKMGRPMEWDVSSVSPDAYMTSSISVQEWVAQTSFQLLPLSLVLVFLPLCP